MTREEILSNSKELVDQIYANMSVIESCSTLAEKVKNLNVCFNNPENNQIVALEDILKPEQLICIRDGIIKQIDESATEAQSFLEKLSIRKPAVLNPVFEQAIKEMKESVVKKVEEPKKSPELTVALAKSLYIEQDMTLDQVAKEVGMSRTRVYNFVNDNGLRKPSKKEKELYRDSKIKKQTP